MYKWVRLHWNSRQIRKAHVCWGDGKEDSREPEKRDKNPKPKEPVVYEVG